MKQVIEAIYERGVFRPLTPLPLGEQERVSLVVETKLDHLLDLEAEEMASQEAEPGLSLDEARAKLAHAAGNWADDVIAERGEY